MGCEHLHSDCHLPATQADCPVPQGEEEEANLTAEPSAHLSPRHRGKATVFPSPPKACLGPPGCQNPNRRHETLCVEALWAWPTISLRPHHLLFPERERIFLSKTDARVPSISRLYFGASHVPWAAAGGRRGPRSAPGPATLRLLRVGCMFNLFPGVSFSGQPEPGNQSHE